LQDATRYVITGRSDARGQDHSGQLIVGDARPLPERSPLLRIPWYLHVVDSRECAQDKPSATRAVVQRMRVAQYPVREQRQRDTRSRQFREHPQDLANFLLCARH
jgi:hypothetical protein